MCIVKTVRYVSPATFWETKDMESANIRSATAAAKSILAVVS
jgi:hypothetical protein